MKMGTAMGLVMLGSVLFDRGAVNYTDGESARVGGRVQPKAVGANRGELWLGPPPWSKRLKRRRRRARVRGGR